LDVIDAAGRSRPLVDSHAQWRVSPAKSWAANAPTATQHSPAVILQAYKRQPIIEIKFLCAERGILSVLI